MEARCTMCGKKIELNPMDKNYEAVKQGKIVFMVCEACAMKTSLEARKLQEQN